VTSSGTTSYAFLLWLLLPCSCCAALPSSAGHPGDPRRAFRKRPSSTLYLSTNYDGPQCRPPPPHVPVSVFPYDVDPVQFALNLEFTEAEFSLHAAFGVGLDQIAPELALGGPPPVGTRKVNLDEMTSRSFFDTVKVDGPPLSLSLGKKYIYISM
jgi:hypothetical protein